MPRVINIETGFNEYTAMGTLFEAMELVNNAKRAASFLFHKAQNQIRAEYVVPFCINWNLEFQTTANDWMLIDENGNVIDEDDSQVGAGFSAEYLPVVNPEAIASEGGWGPELEMPEPLEGEIQEGIAWRKHEGLASPLLENPEFQRQLIELTGILNSEFCPGLFVFSGMASVQ